MNARKMPSVNMWCLMYSRPIRISNAIAIAPKMSIIGELIAAALTERRFARNSRLAASRKRFVSHASMENAFTMRTPVMVSCRMFWISASLSWPLRVVLAYPLPDPPR